MINRIYVDMDGVLADFDKYKEEKIPDWKGKSEDELWDIIWNKHPYWFLNLSTMPDFYQLVNYLDNYEPIVLTAIPKGKNHYRCLWQKQAWLAEEVGWPVICCLRHHKQDYAAEDTLLIDDLEKNVNQFRKAGGHAILHTSAASTIEELKKLL